MKKARDQFENGQKLPITLLVLIAMLGLVQSASAHRPWFNLAGTDRPEDAWVLEDIDVSQVVYGQLEQAGRIDYYLLSAPADFVADLQIVVPDVPACASFRPILIVQGPGIEEVGIVPAISGTPVVATPAAVLANETWGTFFEPFTLTTYATSPRFTETLTGGEYLIAVVEPEGDIGTYGLALGGSEEFGGDPDVLSKIIPIVQCQPEVDAASPSN